MKVKPQKISKEQKIKCLDALYTAVACLETRDEVKKFLRDLLTESERIMIGRRILIAQKLLRDVSYDEIIRELKVGKDTIMRVHRWLSNEPSGYEETIRKLEKVLSNRVKIPTEDGRKLDPFSFQGMKRRYPMHFALFNLFEKLAEKR